MEGGRDEGGADVDHPGTPARGPRLDPAGAPGAPRGAREAPGPPRGSPGDPPWPPPPLPLLLNSNRLGLDSGSNQSGSTSPGSSPDAAWGPWGPVSPEGRGGVRGPGKTRGATAPLIRIRLGFWSQGGVLGAPTGCLQGARPARTLSARSWQLRVCPRCQSDGGSPARPAHK